MSTISDPGSGDSVFSFRQATFLLSGVVIVDRYVCLVLLGDKQ